MKQILSLEAEDLVCVFSYCSIKLCIQHFFVGNYWLCVSDVKQARVFGKSRDFRDERGDRDGYWDDRDRERERDYREDRERESFRDRSPLDDRSRDRRDERDWRPRERDR